MNISQSLQDHCLDNGQTLVYFVGGSSPSQLSRGDIASLSEVWKNCMEEARMNNRMDLTGRADYILQFLSGSRSNVSLLMWKKFRISILPEENTGEFVIVDEA